MTNSTRLAPLENELIAVQVFDSMGPQLFVCIRLFPTSGCCERFISRFYLEQGLAALVPTVGEASELRGRVLETSRRAVGSLMKISASRG